MAEGIITHVKSARKVNKHFICSVCVYDMDALNVLGTVILYVLLID